MTRHSVIFKKLTILYVRKKITFFCKLHSKYSFTKQKIFQSIRIFTQGLWRPQLVKDSISYYCHTPFLRSPKWQGNMASSHHVLATLYCFHRYKSPVSSSGEICKWLIKKTEIFIPGS